MVFISVLVLPFVEVIMLYLFTHVFVRKDKKLYEVVKKNL